MPGLRSHASHAVGGGLAVRLAVLVCLALAAHAADAGAQARQLVVPFESTSPDPETYWLGEGSAVILTDDLLALGAPAITREDRLRAFDRLRVPPVSTLSRATVLRVGQLVGASEVIVGDYEVDGDDIVIRARTIDLASGRMAPPIVERGALADLFRIYARVAQRLVPNAGLTVEQMEQGAPPMDALERYVKGVLAQVPTTKIELLSEALRLHPALHRARLELWQVHTDQGEHDEALTAARGVAPTHRLARRARFLAAVSLLQLERWPEAFDAFAALHAAQPDPALLNNLGIVQLRRPNGEVSRRATAYFLDATVMDRGDGDLFFNLGYATFLDRDLPAAVEWLREAVRRNPADHAAHYVLGVALQSTGRAAEAARERELAKRLSSDYEEWEARNPPVNTVPRGLERVKTEVDLPALLRVESAIVAAEQRDQREVAAFHLDAGRRAYDDERDAEAIASLRRAVFVAPYESEAHLLLGRAYLRAGRLDEAVDAFKIAIWSEDSLAARLALAEAYMQAREEEAARAELDAILAREPDHATARALIERLGGR